MKKILITVLLCMMMCTSAFAERHTTDDWSEYNLKHLASYYIGGHWMLGPFYINGFEFVQEKVFDQLTDVEYVDDDGAFKAKMDGDNGPIIMEGWREWNDNGRLYMHMRLPSGNVYTMFRVEPL